MVTILFGLLLFKSRRFIEYYPAFVLLFGALAWAPLLKSWQQSGSAWARGLPVALALIMVATGGINIQAVRASLQKEAPYQRFAAASAWLKANTPPGSLIYQTDWDDFTQLFYYNTQNIYTLGLDPTYMQSKDPELYELWRETTQGRVDNLGRTIHQKFGAEYAITDLNHQGFLDKAATPWGSGLQEVYRDEYAVIFRVIDQ
jgi:hypothetical protein